LVEVGAVLNRERLLLRAFGGLGVNPKLGLDPLLIVNLLHADEGVIRATVGGGTGHDDVLDKPELEGAHGIEPID
jgi:hypothetical protein